MWRKIYAWQCHYCDVIMSPTASQITSLTIVYSIFYSITDQRKHQRSASLAFVRGIHRRPVNSPHKWPVTREMFPFDDVIMFWSHRLKLFDILGLDITTSEIEQNSPQKRPAKRKVSPFNDVIMGQIRKYDTHFDTKHVYSLTDIIIQFRGIYEVN